MRRSTGRTLFSCLFSGMVARHRGRRHEPWWYWHSLRSIGRSLYNKDHIKIKYCSCELCKTRFGLPEVCKILSTVNCSGIILPLICRPAAEIMRSFDGRNSICSVYLDPVPDDTILIGVTSCISFGKRLPYYDSINNTVLNDSTIK